jgi:hypothetical protein
MAGRDDRGESRRQIARRQQRKAGDRSARLANALMKLPVSALGKLGLNEDLRASVDRARAVTYMSRVAARSARWPAIFAGSIWSRSMPGSRRCRRLERRSRSRFIWPSNGAPG